MIGMKAGHAIVNKPEAISVRFSIHPRLRLEYPIRTAGYRVMRLVIERYILPALQRENSSKHSIVAGKSEQLCLEINARNILVQGDFLSSPASKEWPLAANRRAQIVIQSR